MKNRKYLSIGISFVIVVIAATGFFVITRKTEDLKTTNALLDKAEKGAGNKITYADYLEITNGWDYAKVKEILKTDGSELSKVTVSGSISAVYLWKNADGSNIVITFQDDKVISKAQSGLN